MKKQYETLEFRGLKFRQPKDSWGVEVLYNGKWYSTENLYLRSLPESYKEACDIGLWIGRTYYGSAKFIVSI